MEKDLLVMSFILVFLECVFSLVFCIMSDDISIKSIVKAFCAVIGYTLLFFFSVYLVKELLSVFLSKA